MQAYSDPKRESDPHSLPDVEVFQVRANRKLRKDFDYTCECGYSVCLSCERAYYPMEMESDDPPTSECCSAFLLTPGYYYWYCFPGCLPDSDPVGPFGSYEEALEDAQEGAEPDFGKCATCDDTATQLDAEGKPICGDCSGVDAS